MAIIIEKFAYHYIRPSDNHIDYSNGEIIDIDPKIRKFFIDLIYQLWKAEESGSTLSTAFMDNSDSIAKTLISEIYLSPETLFHNSKKLADILRNVSPKQASPGIISVLLVRNEESENKNYVIIFKIRCDNEELIQVLFGNNQAELDVTEIENTLFKELQKGAIYPHPDKSDFDLKITDKQTINGAKYFSSKFLGCIEKKSEEHQIISLVPALIEYGLNNRIRTNIEKIPDVLQSLSEQTKKIDSNKLVELVEKSDLYGDEFDKSTFELFCLNSTNLSKLDIDPKNFKRKKGGSKRKITYKFRLQEYDGIEISGPPEKMKNLIEVNGDNIVIRISALETAVRVNYG